MKKRETPDSGERCPACRAFTGDQQWQDLRLLYGLNVTEHGPFGRTSWLGRVIEVRECKQCGRGVARALERENR